ncbi:MAG: DHH family phosphoesterase [Chthoniobacteraceae bacterium]
MMKWIFSPPVEPALVQALRRELQLPAFVASHLVRLGVDDPAIAAGFLQPRLKTLSDPFQLPGMERAVTRILQALDRRERIVLYGDYDVDGVTSLALFTKLLKAAGADPKPFLPLRMDEGYGLTPDGVKRCVETYRPQLLITVDCGTSAVAEITALQNEGVDVLVFDHHEAAAELPPCIALVNPKLGDDFHYLCSAGVVFKACHALLKRRPIPGFDLREQLDLVALGTIADIVPLTGENRILVHHGLKQIAETNSAGLRALVEITGIKAPLSPSDVGFRLGPRLNAGRAAGHGRGGARFITHRRSGPGANAGRHARPAKPRAAGGGKPDPARGREADCRNFRRHPRRGDRGERTGLASRRDRHRGLAADAAAPPAGLRDCL